MINKKKIRGIFLEKKEKRKSSILVEEKCNFCFEGLKIKNYILFRQKFKNTTKEIDLTSQEHL